MYGGSWFWYKYQIPRKPPWIPAQPVPMLCLIDYQSPLCAISMPDKWPPWHPIGATEGVTWFHASLTMCWPVWGWHCQKENGGVGGSGMLYSLIISLPNQGKICPPQCWYIQSQKWIHSGLNRSNKNAYQGSH